MIPRSQGFAAPARAALRALLAALGIAAAAALLVPAAAGKPARPAAPAIPTRWDATIRVTPEGYHVVGNPSAPVRIVEFVSYSCPHCGIFEMQGGAELMEKFVRPGLASYEIRPFFRNELDKALTLLAYCGPPVKFFGNSSQLLLNQDKWLRNPTQAQAQRWLSGEHLARMQAMASDLALYDFMAPRGFTPAELDACLADSALGDRLMAQTQDAMIRLDVRGTPTFLINGAQVPENTWPTLKPRLQAMLGGFT